MKSLPLSLRLPAARVWRLTFLPLRGSRMQLIMREAGGGWRWVEGGRCCSCQRVVWLHVHLYRPAISFKEKLWVQNVWLRCTTTGRSVDQMNL